MAATLAVLVFLAGVLALPFTEELLVPVLSVVVLVSPVVSLVVVSLSVVVGAGSTATEPLLLGTASRPLVGGGLGDGEGVGEGDGEGLGEGEGAGLGDGEGVGAGGGSGGGAGAATVEQEADARTVLPLFS